MTKCVNYKDVKLRGNVRIPKCVNWGRVRKVDISLPTEPTPSSAFACPCNLVVPLFILKALYICTLWPPNLKDYFNLRNVF